MRFDLLVVYAHDELDIRSDATKFHERCKSQMLLSENRKTGRILIEAVGITIPDEEIRKAEREQPNNRFYWLDPFRASTLDPDLIAQALRYHCFKAFKLADSIFCWLRQELGIDRYVVTLRLSSYEHLNTTQLQAIRQSLKKKGRFSSVTIEPLPLIVRHF